MEISYDTLDTLLPKQMPLASNLFRLLCYTIANRCTIERSFNETKAAVIDASEEAGDSLDLHGPVTHRHSSHSSWEKKLKLSEGSVILGEFDCKLNHGKDGTLLLTGDTLFFYLAQFGRKTIVKVALKDVRLVTLIDDAHMHIETFGAESGVASYEYQLSSHKDREALNATLQLCLANLGKSVHTSISTAASGGEQQPQSQQQQQQDEAVTLRDGSTIAATPSEAPIHRRALGIESDEWQEILRSCTSELEFTTNDFIIKQGEPQQRLYQIQKGSVSVEIKDEHEEVWQLEETDGTLRLFGEVSFVQGELALVSVVARDPVVRVLAFERYKLEQLFQCRPDLAVVFYRQLALNLIRKHREGGDLFARQGQRPSRTASPTSQ